MKTGDWVRLKGGIYRAIGQVIANHGDTEYDAFTTAGKFLSLPHCIQQALCVELGLTEPAPKENLSDIEVAKLYFKRAKERSLVYKLVSGIDKAFIQHGPG